MREGSQLQLDQRLIERICTYLAPLAPNQASSPQNLRFRGRLSLCAVLLGPFHADVREISIQRLLFGFDCGLHALSGSAVSEKIAETQDRFSR